MAHDYLTQKEMIKWLKRFAIGMVVVASLAVLVAFLLSIASIELTKEMHVSERDDASTSALVNGETQLIDSAEQPVATNKAVYHYELRDIANWPPEDLHKLEVLNLPLQADGLHVMHVTGVLYRPQIRDRITVFSNGAGTAYFGIDLKMM